MASILNSPDVFLGFGARGKNEVHLLQVILGPEDRRQNFPGFSGPAGLALGSFGGLMWGNSGNPDDKLASLLWKAASRTLFSLHSRPAVVVGARRVDARGVFSIFPVLFRICLSFGPREVLCVWDILSSLAAVCVAYEVEWGGGGGG